MKRITKKSNSLFVHFDIFFFDTAKLFDISEISVLFFIQNNKSSHKIEYS